MSADEIPEAIRRLIVEHIDSIPELEALLLLREDRTRAWTAVEAGQRLYVSATVAGHILVKLEQRGFFASEGQGYRYSPGSSEVEQTIDTLAAAYAHHLVSVSELVHAKPSPNARSSVDALRFRGEKK